VIERACLRGTVAGHTTKVLLLGGAIWARKYAFLAYEENAMKFVGAVVLLLAVLVVGVAHAQFPILDLIASKVVEKYQHSTCEQLWEQRGKPKTADEQQVINMLRGDAQMRTAFIDKIAAPVANKMFECGMIP